MKEENKEYDGEPVTLAEVFGKNNSLSNEMLKTFSKFPQLDMTKLGVNLRYEVAESIKKAVENAERRLKEIRIDRICQKVGKNDFIWEEALEEYREEIDKIFKEEFWEKLTK